MKLSPIHTCLLAASVLWACACQEEETTRELTAPVTQGALTFQGVYYGELHASNSVAVHAPSIPNTYSMTIDTVVADGTRVKKGDVLMTFVSETMEMDLRDELDKLQVAQAERRKIVQSLDKERIDLDLEVKRKELQLERSKLAVVEGVNLISKVELDKAKIDVDKAKLELELARKARKAFSQKRSAAMKVEDLKIGAAERAVTNRKKGLGMVEIAAPVDGMVYAPYTRLNWQRTKAAPGVVARAGDKVLELPDLSKYDLHVYVRQRDAAFLKVGDPATVTPLILPDRQIVGKVKSKEDFATTRNERLRTSRPEDNLKEYLVVIELEETHETLRPGNSARVEIRSTLKKDAVLAPLLGLEKQGDGYIAHLPGEATRPVKVGRTTISHAEILEGIQPGDTLVLSRDTRERAPDKK